MRQPKPFFRKFTKSWYVQIRGKQINLGRDRKQAWARYRQLTASPEELDAHTTTVHGLFDLYLAWVQKNRSAATYDAARRYLSSFARTLPKSLVVSKLAPSYITTWMSDHATWGDTTRNDAISHVQRAFHWAVNQRLLTRYPLPKLEDKPSRKRREVVYSPAEFQAILNAIPDREFRDLLEFLWETGCRPIEARILEATHVDIAKKIAILPPSSNKTRKAERVIILNQKATEICRRLVCQHPDGAIFRNTRGRPWTKDSINCRFQRLKKKLGKQKMCAYGIRHSYATEGLKNDVDPVSLAMLMGHQDASMVATTYQHLAQDHEHLRRQSERAKGQDAT